MTQGSETERAFFLDLSARAKLRVTGADRFRFLNGQITNDLRKASETAAIEACVLNAKGKLNAHIFIAALGESFLIDAEPELRETLRARLERYVIADDVQIEDVTDEFSLFHVLTEDSPAAGVWPDCFRATFCHDRLGHLERPSAPRCCATMNWPQRYLVYRFCSRGCDANRTRAAALGPRTYRRNYSDRSKSRTTHDRLRKGLLHRSGSDLPNQNVRTNQQTIVRIDLAEQHAAPAWDETSSLLQHLEKKPAGSRARRAANDLEKKSRSAT